MRFLSLFTLLNLILTTSIIFSDEGGFRVVKEFENKRLKRCSSNSFLCVGEFNQTFRTVWSDGVKYVDLDIDIKSRINGDEFYYQKPVTAVHLPMEFRIRTNLNGVDKIISLNDVKIGLFKLLIRKPEISLQLISYYFTKYDFKTGIFHGLKAISITFSDAIALMEDKSIELIVRASGSLAAGKLFDNKTISKTRSDDIENLDTLTLLKHSGNGSLA